MCSFEGTGKSRRNPAEDGKNHLQKGQETVLFFVMAYESIAYTIFYISGRGKMQNQDKYERIKHTFQPVYDENSEILILGSFPSVKSREYGFYYGHPQNRFWKVLGSLYEDDANYFVNCSKEEKIEFLLKYHIAIWDVIDECDIIGSSDSSIRNVIPSDIKRIVEKSQVKRIFVNGKVAKRLYDKYSYDDVKIEAEVLPSTSPANAASNLEKLVEMWGKIKF